MSSAGLNPRLRDWHGQGVWIVGASSGIGLATAEALAVAGARVVVSARKAGPLQDFAARGVLLMRADWTLRDAVITEELRRLGRSGVPVYALHVPGAAAPVLLPEILSATGVREALAHSLKPS